MRSHASFCFEIILYKYNTLQIYLREIYFLYIAFYFPRNRKEKEERIFRLA